MTTHILNMGRDLTLCEEQEIGDNAITLEQALDPNDEISFDCVNCHRILTGSQSHSNPENAWR